MDQPTRRLNTPNDAKSTTNCPNCQGVRYWAESVAKDAWGRYSAIHLSTTKGIRFLTGPDKVYTLCVALVCSECGYTEFYAEDPKRLLKPQGSLRNSVVMRLHRRRAVPVSGNAHRCESQRLAA